MPLTPHVSLLTCLWAPGLQAQRWHGADEAQEPSPHRTCAAPHWIPGIPGWPGMPGSVPGDSVISDSDPATDRGQVLDRVPHSVTRRTRQIGADSSMLSTGPSPGPADGLLSAAIFRNSLRLAPTLHTQLNGPHEKQNLSGTQQSKTSRCCHHSGSHPTQLRPVTLTKSRRTVPHTWIYVTPL